MHNQDIGDLEWMISLVDEVRSEVTKIGNDLADLSHAIHGHPELRFEEFFASSLIVEYLESENFEVTTSIAGMDTAFRAERRFGESGPTIGIFCEYDALPGIGHACGHNIIAAAGAGAGVVVSRWLQKNNSFSGRVVVVGSPGEEGGGGKIRLMAAGALAEFDAMVMVHPSSYNAVDRKNLGRIALDINFEGQAAHAAAAPELGRNALDGATLLLNAIALLRQQIRTDSRIHAIVSDGGQAVNTIPEKAQVKLFIRSPDEKYLRERLEKAIYDCAEGCAKATGTLVEIVESSPPYMSILPNPVLASLGRRAFELIGRTINEKFDRPISFASTDMGNVSRIVSSIHPYICVNSNSVVHTREFEKVANSKSGDLAVCDGATVLAAIVLSLITRPNLVEEAKRAFIQTRDSECR